MSEQLLPCAFCGVKLLRVLQKNLLWELLAAAKAVVDLIEGFPGYGTLCDAVESVRLKDRPVWVSFYNLVKASARTSPAPIGGGDALRVAATQVVAAWANGLWDDRPGDDLIKAVAALADALATRTDPPKADGEAAFEQECFEAAADRIRQRRESLLPPDELAELREGENALVVDSKPLGCSYTHEYEHCQHLWEVYGDGGDLGGNRIEVKCRRCGCPGDYNEDFGSVTWPTT